MKLKETLEEAAERYAENKSSAEVFQEAHIIDFIAGANYQAERMYCEAISRSEYSEEELREAFHVGRLYQGREGDINFEKWFKQFKKK